MEIDRDLSASTQSMPELSKNAVNDSLRSSIFFAPVSKKGIGVLWLQLNPVDRQ